MALSKTNGPRDRLAGFSLIEVNLAVLMIAVGLLSLFALFPLGLRQSEMSITDTNEALFAEYVLCGLEGNAQDVSDWEQWSDLSQFVTNMIAGVTPVEDFSTWSKYTDPDTSASLYLHTSTNLTGNQSNGVLFPDGGKRKVRYEVRVWDAGSDGFRKSVLLRVKSGSNFDEPQSYYTEFAYFGM